MIFTSAVVLIVLVQIWLIIPLFDPGPLGRAIPILLVLLLTAFRQIAVSGQWGLERRAFLSACWLSVLATVPLLLLTGLVVLLTPSRRFPAIGELAPTLGFLFLWALGQQFTLQTVIFEESAKKVDHGWKAVIIAAALFAAVHLPNPFLTVATFAGGLVWCNIYRRYPNILPLAFSHAVCSMALITAFSREVTGGMRVGYSYFAFWTG